MFLLNSVPETNGRARALPSIYQYATEFLGVSSSVGSPLESCILQHLKEPCANMTSVLSTHVYSLCVALHPLAPLGYLPYIGVGLFCFYHKYAELKVIEEFLRSLDLSHRFRMETVSAV